MALIEVFHVCASQLSIDATSTTDIPQGCLVGLDANGQVTLANGATTRALGIAGDSRSQGTTSYSAESGSALSRDPANTLEGALVIGAYGAQQRYTQNRIPDNYNEVLASGKMTVYHSGGEFWTDQYEITQSNGTTLNDFTPGDLLYASASGETIGTSAGEAVARSGRFTEQVAGRSVGVVFTSPTSYPSGVPGTETGFSSLPEGGNSLSWGTFLHVKLEI